MVTRPSLGFGISEGRIGRFLIACMALGFAALVAAGIAAGWSTARNSEHNRDINHTYEVELAIGRARSVIEQSETARRGYVLTANLAYLTNYRATMAQLPAALGRVTTLTRDNPRQQRNIALLSELVDNLAQHREATIALTRAGARDRARALFATESNARRILALRMRTDAMIVEEQRLLAIRDAAQRASVHAFYAALGTAALLLILVAAATVLTMLRYTRDLAASRDTLRDFADTLEAQVGERTADLSRANAEIQRFAYIVSHDLRSPLVNVMGFTAELESASRAIGALIDRTEATAPELVTAEARIAAREDLPEAIGFIRTSTQKMDRLINAILKLSREGRRVIAPQPLDMTALVETIAASLQTQLEQRGATLEIAAPLPDLVSDRLAIEQILSNLIENAVKYVSPDRPGRIIVRGIPQGRRVSYEVIDNGRGIAPGDHERVFDLFRRAGNQDQPGEGIGLAHVRALAYRLGGVIDLRSELDRGSTFRLELPRMFVEPATPDRREPQE